MLKNFIFSHPGQEGRYFHVSRTLAFLFLILFLWVPTSAGKVNASQHPAGSGDSPIFLPGIMNGTARSRQAMHIPFFDTKENVFESHFGAMGIFWFGKVSPNDTYTDVRTGYNQEALFINLATIDRLLWYDSPTTAADLLKWDSASLFLHVPASGNRPERTVRFDAELNHWEPRANFQAAYQFNGLTWQRTNLSFTTVSGWEGNAPGDFVEDRGWFVTFKIPFSSLSDIGTPAPNETWQMGITVYNRNSESVSTVLATKWPDNFRASVLSSWNDIAFGIPTYSPPQAVNPKTLTIRQGNGVTVKDGAVGGWTVCGQGLNFWTEWGNKVYLGEAADTINIQNQHNIADWPCFSRYYVSFPINNIPIGKKIISAKLILHQFGNSYPEQAEGSIIQVLKVSQAWDESTLSWNHSPQAVDNYGGTWVPKLLSFPGWPGVARQWNISRAVAEAYNARSQVLHLALYSADWPLHSGKYFVSSDVDDWNSQARPTLVITYGD